jgi:hypothetical protein
MTYGPSTVPSGLVIWTDCIPWQSNPVPPPTCPEPLQVRNSIAVEDADCGRSVIATPLERASFIGLTAENFTYAVPACSHTATVREICVPIGPSDSMSKFCCTG